EALDAVDADHLRRLGDVVLLQGVQVGAAAEQLGRAPGLVQERDGLLRGLGPVVLEVLHDCFPPFLAASAARTRSLVNGECGTRTPRALNTALLMAAFVEMVGGSPMPMTPRSGMSIMWTTISGMSRMPPSL